MSLPATTLRRVQVLDLRRRLERLAASVFDAACQPAETGAQNRIHARLTFIYTIKDTSLGSSQRYQLVRLGRHVYAKSSDVMHGRTSMINLPQVIIDEWRSIIEQLESFVEDSSQSVESE